MNHEKITLAALDCGAAGAAVIPAAEIVLDASFADLCKSNSCGYYGRCWMCPPDIGPIQEMMNRVRRFPLGLIYQTIGQLEDSFDIEGMSEAARVHGTVSQKIQEKLRPLLCGEIYHLSCGGCSLCKRCAKLDDLPCRFPDRALPPMEGAGIDVYNTAKAAQMNYVNGKNTVTYFGLVLFEEQDDA